MINLEEAKEEFKKYVTQFDLQDENITRKVDHSFRVMEISQELCKNLQVSQEEQEIATLIGLLHDIGRFEQRTKFKTFWDHQSIDHGDLGVEILEENNYLRNYILEDQYDEVIKKAIRNHGKLVIEEGLNEKELFFAQLIRDADKLDIFYEAIVMFWKGKEKQMAGQLITPKVLMQFEDKKTVQNIDKQNELDNLVGILSFIYGINFIESYHILKERNYIDQILNRFEFQGETKEKMEQIRKIAKEVIEKK